MIRYKIEGDNLPVVICYPEAGQTLMTESGAMSWMSPNMRMTTNTGGGIRKMFGRMFSGESIFMNEYTAEGGTGMIAFASSFPGSIIPFRVTPGNGIIVQKHGFLAMEKGLEMSVHFHRRFVVVVYKNITDAKILFFENIENLFIKRGADSLSS